jgi:hypothetical protein
MAWECPHLDQQDDTCRRLKQACVPGRPGCALPKNLVFAVPAEVRLAELSQQAQAQQTVGPDPDKSAVK